MLAVGLFLVRNFGRRLLPRLPLPTRVVEFYDRFEEGLFSIEARSVPRSRLLTALIWTTEALRLYFVILAMGFDLPIGIWGGLLRGPHRVAADRDPVHARRTRPGRGWRRRHPDLVYGATPTQAAAIALVDRAISVLSVIVFGGIAYWSRTRPRAAA